MAAGRVEDGWGMGVGRVGDGCGGGNFCTEKLNDRNDEFLRFCFFQVLFYAPKFFELSSEEKTYDCRNVMADSR